MFVTCVLYGAESSRHHCNYVICYYRMKKNSLFAIIRHSPTLVETKLNFYYNALSNRFPVRDGAGGGRLTSSLHAHKLRPSENRRLKNMKLFTFFCFFFLAKRLLHADIYNGHIISNISRERLNP